MERITHYLSKVYLDGTGSMAEYLTVEEFHDKYGWGGELSLKDARRIESAMFDYLTNSHEPVMTTYLPRVTARYSVTLMSQAYERYRDGYPLDESKQVEA